MRRWGLALLQLHFPVALALALAWTRSEADVGLSRIRLQAAYGTVICDHAGCSALARGSWQTAYAIASACRMTARLDQVQVPEPSRRFVPLLQLATAHFRSQRL